jgi:hypothetical protein
MHGTGTVFIPEGKTLGYVFLPKVALEPVCGSGYHTGGDQPDGIDHR